MKKTIQFKDNFGEYSNGTPYIIAENDPLSISFDFSGNSQKPKRLKVVYAVGTKKSRILDVSDHVLQIPYSFFDEALKPSGKGLISMELHEFTETGFAINEGRYTVEPLELNKVHERIEGCAVIQVLKNQITTLKDELKTTADKAKRNKVATLRYLYRHYTKDFIDSDANLSVKAFARAIGMDVSDLYEEELNEIANYAYIQGVI